jgi:superfamily II DNA or RNA helicase
MAQGSPAVASAVLSRFEPYFSARTRTRGVQYATTRRVTLGDANHAWLSAVVRGSERYDVELELRGTSVAASCTCPYFADSEPCKHIWATLIVGESEGALPWLSDTRGMVFDPVDEDDAPLDDDLDDLDEPKDDAFDDGSDTPARRPRLHVMPLPSAAPGRPPLAPSLSWRDVHAFAATQATPPSFYGRADLRFVIDTKRTRAAGRLHVRLFKRAGKQTAPEWKETLVSHPLSTFAPPSEAFLVAMLEASARDSFYASYASRSGFDLQPDTARDLVERLCASGRLRLDAAGGPVVAWDPSPYRVALDVASVDRGHYEVRAALERPGERVDAEAPALVLAAGLALWPDRAAPVDGPSLPWVIQHRLHGPIHLPERDVDDFVEAMHAHPLTPILRLPSERALQETSVEGKPYVRFEVVRNALETGVGAEAGCDYAGTRALLSAPGRAVLDRDRRLLVTRDGAAEDQARQQLAAAGVRPMGHAPSYGRRGASPALTYRVAVGRLEAAACDLVAAGWRVEVNGKLRRSAGDFHVDVTSGIDWLDVRVQAKFDGVEAPLPELLAAIRQKRLTVTLADGSVGLLPEAWTERLRRWASVASAGADPKADALRFTRSQASLVAALVDREEHATVDASFTALRATLDSFSGVKPLDAPKTFRGTLRDYQRYAQGWFAALRQLGLGGCLADDMGLGKTVQVLAMLERRRKERPSPGPSLVVAPRSVITNWADEAARFAPGLRVLVHSGSERMAPGEHLGRHDLVLVTYGVLRKDAAALGRFAFDYVILDEAQAIKTAGTETAKASRLLRARHRLALTGTPIENHLGELGSLLDFLNPGILGVGGFAALGSGNRRVDPTTLGVVARSVRPFLLRRTKREVARELPDRVEQTVACDLPGDQRKLYDELHAHYRASIAARVKRDGIAKSTVHILEALLRLRQAACHPGLIDDARRTDPSAKLDALLDRLTAIRDQGQKALVFSQFTSFLSIVRERLTERGIDHAYLDGRTRDRAACVARFQSDPDCGVFLISLKAGGLGLNLTAAEYVFLLDPWWNPAVEAQAIDRAHRIGQTRNVIAYRLLARGTVEEKVAELQLQKKALADALLGDSAAALGALTREDLERLLA